MAGARASLLWSAFFSHHNMIKTKSIYDQASEEDGLRVLVTRYWPRGVSKDRVHLWCKDLSPTPELISSFKSGKISWSGFRAAYLKDFSTAESQKSLKEASSRIMEQALVLERPCTITLLCACRESSRCHRSLLSPILEEVLKP